MNQETYTFEIPSRKAEPRIPPQTVQWTAAEIDQALKADNTFWATDRASMTAKETAERKLAEEKK